MEILESYYKVSPFFFVLAASSSLLFAVSLVAMSLDGDAGDGLMGWSHGE